MTQKGVIFGPLFGGLWEGLGRPWQGLPGSRPIWGTFWPVTARYWPKGLRGPQKGSQKGVKNDPKMTHFGSFLGSFLDPFLVGFQARPHDFGVKNGSKIGSQKGSQRAILDPKMGHFWDPFLRGPGQVLASPSVI